MYQIKKELKENIQGLEDHRKVEEELIVKESGIKYHLFIYIYRRILRKWGFRQKCSKKSTR
jgi:hypothetical protein